MPCRTSRTTTKSSVFRVTLVLTTSKRPTASLLASITPMSTPVISAPKRCLRPLAKPTKSSQMQPSASSTTNLVSIISKQAFAAAVATLRVMRAIPLLVLTRIKSILASLPISKTLSTSCWGAWVRRTFAAVVQAPATQGVTIRAVTMMWKRPFTSALVKLMRVVSAA